jgi:hypothetical protein
MIGEEEPELRLPRIHFQLDTPRDTSQMIVAGPKTFRRASKKVLSDKRERAHNNYGGNRQNLSKRMRQIWCADKGYKLVNRDQEGADALIVAYLCKQGRYRSLFQNGIKPHLYLALRFFPDEIKKHITPDYVDVACKTEIASLTKLDFWPQLVKLIKSTDDWSPTKRIYYFGKKTGHAGNYGMGENKLVNVILEETQGEIVLPKAEAGRWLTTYHTVLFPEIKRDFQYNAKKEAEEKHQLRNLFGFPFNITFKVRESDYEVIYAWKPQSTVACITAEAIIKMQQYIESEDKDWHILQETHDSITMEAPDNEAEEAATKLDEFFAVTLKSPVDGVEFTMKTGCQISASGGNWSPYDKDKNPLGLQEVKL